MTAPQAHLDRARYASQLRSFTLMELLVVMGIVALMGVLTALGYRAVAKDAKMSSAKNTVMAVLDNARGMAMRENRLVMVVFRPRLDGNRQYVEAVLAVWPSESGLLRVPQFGVGTQIRALDRFERLNNIAPRRLPAGVGIAGPAYGGNSDFQWQTLSYLPQIRQNGSGAGQGEAPGVLLGIMYAPNGEVVTRNSHRDSDRAWVDFNGNSLHDWGGNSNNYNAQIPPDVDMSFFNGGFFEHRFEDDECFISLVPYLSVYDEDVLRERFNVSTWNFVISGNSAYQQRLTDHTEFVTNNADRIHFNRYTGVALR